MEKLEKDELVATVAGGCIQRHQRYIRRAMNLRDSMTDSAYTFVVNTILDSMSGCGNGTNTM